MKNKLLLFLLFFSFYTPVIKAGSREKNVNPLSFIAHRSIIPTAIDPVKKLNKSVATTKSYATLSPPTTIAGSSCGDGVNFVQVNVYANGASSDEIIEWFASQNSTSPLYTGYVYSPSIKTTKTFYVRSRSQSTNDVSIRVPVVASVYLSPPQVTLTASPNNSGTELLCLGTAVTFTANGGGDLFEFSVEGVVVQAMSASRTYTTSTLSDGQTVSVRTRYNKTIDGSTAEFAWGTGPLEDNVLSAPLSSNAASAYINGLKVSPEEDKIVIGISGKITKDKSLLLFLDSKTGGFNVSNFGDVIGSSNAKAFNYFNNNPSTFDSYFQADYCLVISTDANAINYFADIIELKTGESIRTSLGSASQGNPTATFGVNTANSGTTDYNLGFEVEILKSLLGYTTGDIKFFGFTMQADDSNFSVTNSFLSPEIASNSEYGNVAVDYNSKDPNPVVFSSAALTPCYTNAYFTMNFYVKPIASSVVQPTCSVTSGTITIGEQNGAEYSIDGVNYRSSNVFSNLTPNNYTLYTRKSIDGSCPNVSESAVTINAVPTPPLLPTSESVVQPTCELQSGTISITSQTAVEYSLDGTTYQTSNVFSGLAPNSYTLYVRNIGDTTCESSSSFATIINNIPPPPISPISGGDQIVCEQTPIQTLTATATAGAGQTIVWYDAATAGNIVTNPILNTVGTITYYAQAENSVTVCKSAGRTAVTLTINPKAVNPISGGDKTECVMSPVQTLTATATVLTAESVVWYNAPTGGSVVANPILNTVGTRTYYAQASNNATACSSDSRTAVTLTILPSPARPVSGGDKVECALSPIQTLTATATVGTGETVVWYDASTGGTVVANPILNSLGTITYYAQTVNDAAGCISSNRTAVTLTLNPKPINPVSGGNQTQCAASPLQTLTATATVASGESVIWYTAATGGSVVTNPTLNTIDTITYYAQTTNNATTCLSDSRTAVTLTINPNPVKPVSGGDKTECAQSPIQTLTATATVGAGESVVWYDAMTGGAIVTNPILNSVGTKTYYAQTVNDATACVSTTRTAVKLTINKSPTAPVSGGDKTECVQTPLQTLTATATVGAAETLVWYTAATGGNIVVNPTLNAVGTITYYAESSNGICSSLTRTAVNLTIVGVVPNPVAADQTVCSDGTTTQTLTATATTATGTITWYTSAVGGTAVANPTLVGVGTKIYYAESSVGSCLSVNRTKVTLTITAVPLKPTVMSLVHPSCVTPSGIITLASQIGVEYNIGKGFQDSPVFSNLTPGNYTPSVRFKNNTSCEVMGTVLIINPVPAPIQFEIVGDCNDKEYVLTANALQNSYDTNNVVYVWKNNSGGTVGTNSNTLNVSDLIGNNGNSTIFPLTYTLTISNAATGCETTNSVAVESIYCNIQRGISPDGNGMNESFDLSLLDVKKLEVFDRYGIKVYSKANYTNQWKGQSDKGEELPSATYYYVIEFNNAKAKTGWIYLIREK
ncbi:MULTISPECIES: gliding motility-associated C-terminal domain-containing protein [unclassified Flavobacterium]|uniref:gliding motility-associated C-terminal domain-containing protein n=1 Tax=unclassified Flavobacterium TaxID=196869 RepID=UPI003F91CCBE